MSPSNETTERRFRGRILGAGSTSGVRFVVGMWESSPFGAFTDVFVELPDGSSVLLAPDEIVAAYVSGTYRFDAVSVVDISARRTARGLELDAGPLVASVDVGTISPLGRVLRIVPKRIARDPRWLTVIDPVAKLVAPGAGTAGTAGGRPPRVLRRHRGARRGGCPWHLGGGSPSGSSRPWTRRCGSASRRCRGSRRWSTSRRPSASAPDRCRPRRRGRSGVAGVGRASRQMSLAHPEPIGADWRERFASRSRPRAGSRGARRKGAS
ncbi:hypothetical protein [Curtobacterium sp. MCJR17_043]|uniref:hypothetical protein n=1 Tax=Curtobacterium sp. MCJR17_043 TaxID=2175660 RepID=UPI0024DF67B8|nr:hypothetical protein [Curtobacterium sp. MCJR17_043]WIB35423.1 hypothetical protein DEJ15_14360 [Curtobacterium sp. MCJR17_043]